MTLALSLAALAIGILAFAHSIRMKLWIERIEARRFEREEPEAWWI